MPIGKNSLKRVTNNGYSAVKTAAPDMENSTVVTEPTPVAETKPTTPNAEKPAAKKATAPKSTTAKKAATAKADTKPSGDAEPAAEITGGMADEDFSANSPACRVWSNVDSSAYVYKCSAKGFEGTNKATVTVNKDAGTVTSVTVDEFGDTTGIGDAATADAELAKYAGASLDSAIDATSGASFTSKALRAMTAAALNMAAGN